MNAPYIEAGITGVRDPLNLAFHGIFFVAAILGMALKKERGHRPLAYSVLVVLVAYTVDDTR